VCLLSHTHQTTQCIFSDVGPVHVPPLNISAVFRSKSWPCQKCSRPEVLLQYPKKKPKLRSPLSSIPKFSGLKLASALFLDAQQSTRHKWTQQQSRQLPEKQCPATVAQHGRCADKRTCGKGSLKINDLKNAGQRRTRKRLEGTRHFMDWKLRDKLLRKYQSQLMPASATTSSSRPNQCHHLLIPHRQSNAWYLLITVTVIQI